MNENHLENEKDKFISLEEACELLETAQPEVEALIRQGKLHAFKIGDSVVRFRKDQVGEIKAKRRIASDLFAPEPGDAARRPVQTAIKANFADHFRDFFYFNDFYILSAVLIASLLYLILSSQ